MNPFPIPSSLFDQLLEELTDNKKPDTDSELYSTDAEFQGWIEIVKNHNAGLFLVLRKLIKQQPIETVQFLTDFFEPYPGKPKICRNKLTFGYICLTCRQNLFAKRCSDCFDLEYHKDHNYYIQTGNGQCECGFVGCDNLCAKHPIPYDYSFEIEKPEEKFRPFVAFTAAFFNLILSVKGANRRQYARIFHEILAKMTKLNEQNASYIEVTAYCLSLPFKGKQNMTLLQQLLELNRSENFLQVSSCNFFQILISNPSFQIIFLKSVFKIPGIYNELDSTLRVLKNLAEKLLKSHVIMAELAKREIIAFPSCHLAPHNCYWSLVDHLAYYNSMDNKVEESLIAIAKLLAKKYGFGFVQSNVSNLTFFYSKISSDRQLIVDLVKHLIYNKKYVDLSQKRPTDNQWYNMIVRIVLCAVNGEIEKFSAFFTTFNVEKIFEFLVNFFKQIMRTNRKGKCNGLTAKCLFKTAQAFDLVDKIANLSIDSPVGCKNFSVNMRIILRNIVSVEHLEAFELMKIAEQKKNENKVAFYRKIILEWFHNFLSYKKEVSQEVIFSMKRQKLIHFKEIAELLENQTNFIPERKVFVYKGKERKLSQNFLLWEIEKPQNFQGLRYGDEENNFSCSPENQQLLMALYSENIKKVDLKNFSSCSRKQRYEISLAAVILDKLLKGKSQNVRKYIEDLRAISKKMTKPNQNLERLLSFKLAGLQLKIKKREQLVQKVQVEPIKLDSMPQIPIEIPQKKEQQQLKVTPKAQKNLSAAELQTSRKRAQKMSRIKQKFQRKSTKYSQSHLPSLHSQKQQQVCLICRETSSTPKQKSYLYYLASLKSDQLTKLAFGLDNNELFLTSCFHPFHQKCLTNMNVTTCILCKSQGNFVLPVYGEGVEMDMFLGAWWRDFLQLASFVPKPAHTYSYSYSYYSNPQPPKTTPADSPQLQKSKSQLKARPFKNFLIIYRILVLRLSALFSKSKLEDSIKKHSYFYNLIDYFYSRLSAEEKAMVKEEIKVYYEDALIGSRVTGYIKNLSVAASRCIISRLDQDNDNGVGQEQAIDLCKKVIYQYPKNLTQNFCLNISWFLNQKLLPPQPQPRSPASLCSPITHIYNIQLPPTMHSLYLQRRQCSSCHRLQTRYCLFCSTMGCNACESAPNHARNAHGGTALCLGTNGRILAIVKGLPLLDVAGYFDVYGCGFQEASSLELGEYRSSERVLNMALQAIFKKL